MWPARLTRYGHEGTIEPHCGRCVWVGLQPETLADRLLVKQSQPASTIETNSDNNFENLYKS
eukprot:1153301-Pelagomonas_calceolata.AAC.2